MAYNKVTYKGDVIMDITDSTVTPETLGEGVVAYGANGERMVGTNAGGATSWNDLSDKPFYSEIVEGASPFDGDLTGKECINNIFGDITLVKITDNTVTPEQLVGSTIVAKASESFGGDLTVEITEDMIQVSKASETSGMIIVEFEDTPLIMTTYGDVVSEGAPFSNGTYFAYILVGDEIIYTHSLSCLTGAQEVVHTIDEKYIPNTIVRANEIPRTIIDVTELPTKNIDAQAIYRLTNKGYRVWSGEIEDGIVLIVDKLPEVGESYEDNKVQYYVTTENRFYYFENNSWHRVDVKVDVLQLGTPYDEIGSGLLLDSRLYVYNNGWVEIGSKISRGSGKLSVIMNSFENQASGDYSHAEGKETTASGTESHAEGWDTMASGDCSHAEGSKTTASSACSHAEGSKTTASGYYSHAEGQEAHAEGEQSHAEGGRSHAKGDYSHAEGCVAIASGHVSHAEGYYTTASGEHQHVQGKYNIEDTENKYAHIVGNGDYEKRSNAHTLDWDGNAWYAGTIEGTAMIIKSPNGTRFQITIDDNGNLSATAIVEETEPTT